MSISNYKDTIWPFLVSPKNHGSYGTGDATRLNRFKLHSTATKTLQQVTFGACKRLQCLADGFNRAMRHCKKSKTACHLP